MSVYDNTSGEPQDSMAVMYLYLLDHHFQRPELDRVGAGRKGEAKSGTRD